MARTPTLQNRGGTTGAAYILYKYTRRGGGSLRVGRGPDRSPRGLLGRGVIRLYQG